MVAVDHNRVVLLVEDDPKNISHGLNGNPLFLGTLHINHMVTDRIGCEKVAVFFADLILLAEGSEWRVNMNRREWGEGEELGEHTP